MGKHGFRKLDQISEHRAKPHVAGDRTVGNRAYEGCSLSRQKLLKRVGAVKPPLLLFDFPDQREPLVLIKLAQCAGLF